MNDTEEPKKKGRSRIRKALPTMPWQRKNTGIGSSISFARAALRRKRASCPNCENGHLTVRDAVEHDGGSIATPLLVCDNCGYTQNISFELDNVAEKIASLRLGERRFLFAALGAFTFGLLYLVIAGNLFTMIGATLIAVLLFGNALFFRYRVWQLTFSRVFEPRAPWLDWLKYEMSNKE